MVFTVAPDVAIVTDVGSAAEANGMVKVWRTPNVLSPQPPGASYEITPSTRIVATYKPVPTSEYPTNEKVGLKIGVDVPHAGEQSLCEMFTCPANGEAVEPAANVKVMFAEFCLQPI